MAWRHPYMYMKQNFCEQRVFEEPNGMNGVIKTDIKGVPSIFALSYVQRIPTTVFWLFLWF